MTVGTDLHEKHIMRVRSKARTSLSKSDDVSSILTPAAIQDTPPSTFLLRKVRCMMNFPTNCSNCNFRERCDASMYTDKCHFFKPEDKPKTFSLKRFFSKIFA